MADQLELEDFDTAKAVFEKLKDVPSERRKRILTWVAEGLGIALSSAPLEAPPALSPLAPPTDQSHPPHHSRTPAVDIKTFVASKAPKSDVQFAATVAYYYRFEAPPSTRRETINGDTLQEAARLAGRKRLANPRVTLNNAKTTGYLDGASPGEFLINTVGENLVAMALGNSSAEANGKKKATRRKG